MPAQCPAPAALQAPSASNRSLGVLQKLKLWVARVALLQQRCQRRQQKPNRAAQIAIPTDPLLLRPAAGVGLYGKWQTRVGRVGHSYAGKCRVFQRSLLPLCTKQAPLGRGAAHHAMPCCAALCCTALRT